MGTFLVQSFNLVLLFDVTVARNTIHPIPAGAAGPRIRIAADPLCACTEETCCIMSDGEEYGHRQLRAPPPPPLLERRNGEVGSRHHSSSALQLHSHRFVPVVSHQSMQQGPP
jgi:hypothetical protein